MFIDIFFSELEMVCNEFISGKLGIKAFQSNINLIESQITSIEHNAIKDSLIYADGDIELILYTEDLGDQYAKGCKVANRILKMIYAWEKHGEVDY